MSTLKSLIAEGEHQQQDFKFRIDDQKKIARTLVAFANTDGGRLLIGVKDNGKITGINPEEEYHMIEGAASLFCKPPVVFESHIWQEDFRLVLEIKVKPNPAKNHRALDDDSKWKVYVRKKDHTLLANKILLNVWNLQRKGTSKPAQLHEDALSLLKIIDENQPVTLSQLYRFSNLPKNQVDEWLSLFVYWENVSMNLLVKGTTYSIYLGEN